MKFRLTVQSDGRSVLRIFHIASCAHLQEQNKASFTFMLRDLKKKWKGILFCSKRPAISTYHAESILLYKYTDLYISGALTQTHSERCGRLPENDTLREKNKLTYNTLKLLKID